MSVVGAGTAFLWTGKSSYLITVVSHSVFLGCLNRCGGGGGSPQVIIFALAVLGRTTDGCVQWCEVQIQCPWVSVGHTREWNEWWDTLRSSDTLGKEMGVSHAQLVMEELLTFDLDGTRLNNQTRGPIVYNL